MIICRNAHRESFFSSSDTTKQVPFVLSVPIRGSPVPQPVPVTVQRDKTKDCECGPSPTGALPGS